MSAKASWPQVGFCDALDSKSGIVRPRKKIAARSYLSSGRIPVVDQGKQAVAGWTNEADSVVETPLPVIVFGDHTRVFKYIDYPFAAGADGTLIFRPAELFDPRFFYYACLGIDLPNRGYNRHFTILRERALPRPEPSEQQSIAAVLAETEAAVEIETERLRVARELKQAALAEVFSRGLRGERQRETAYGLVPKSWTDRQLSGCSYVQTGVAKNSRNVSADALEVPYLRVANVQDGHLDLSEMKTIRIPEREIESCLLREGDVVLTEGGDFDKLGRGFVWEGQIPRCVHQNHVFAVRTDRDQLDPFFFAYLAQSPYGKAYFLSVAHKTTNLACINTTKLRAFPVILPLLDEQREIGDLFRSIDARIARHEARQRLMRELFASLLRDLMTGRRRVTEVAS